MPGLIDIHGNQYTSVTEDIRVKTLKEAFRKVLAQEIHRALNARRGQMAPLDLKPIEHFIDQAYYMGREDGK